MMKKIYAIFPLLLALLAVSCVREQPLDTGEFVKEEAETVPVVLSFQNPLVLQAGTKAEPGMEMGEEPAISNIHVAIFGTDRYLKDYVSAYPCDSQGNPLSGGFASENATSAYFLARLPISSKERVLHIIANGPSSLPFNAYENDIMQSMTVTEGNGAYWQRITLPNGIRVLEVDGNREQTPDGEFIPTTETVAALSDLKLIRNFASITVTEDASNFEIVSYTLCNMPRSGAVAMYSTNHGDWVPDYANPSNTLSQHLYSYEDTDDSTVKTYLGFPADPDIDTNIPTTVDALNAPGVSVAPGTPIYVYERAVTTENPPFILMAARYVTTGTPTSSTPIHYYRLDLALESGYFPIYRNYRYSVNISGVSVDGFEDPATAAGHNSGSNFSVSLDTRTLPDISNGIVRLYVEQPNFDWVYTPNQQEFWFKFLLNNATSGNLNGYVTVTEKEGDAINTLSVDSADTGTDNQRYVKYTLNVPNGTSTLSSTLQLVGSYTDGPDTYRLVRMVTIRVFNAKEIHPSLSPATVADEAGQLTTLSIPLPWDLQASMFPMEILIEDSAKALNPASNENMPVKTTGIENLAEAFKSLSGNGQSSYCFVRTLNWSEYLRLKNNAELSGSDDIVLTCDFETTKAFSSSTVYVYNKYFATNPSTGVTTAQTSLSGDPDNNITPNRQNVSGQSATVRVKSTGNWVLNISLASGGVASGTNLSPSSGTATSGQDVTVTLPENVTENAIRYLVKLTNTSVTPNLERSAYITQEGIMMKLTSAISTVDNASNSVTVTVESGTKYVIELIGPNGDVISTSTENNATTGPTNHTVIIPQNTTIRERKFTVRARNLLSTVWEDVIITQEPGVATLTAANPEIRMTQTSATVNVTSSFATVLKAYIQGNDTPIFTADMSASTTGHDETITGIPVNNTGADRHIIVNLCDASGTILASRTLTQFGSAAIKLTTADGNIDNTDTSASINVDSEAAWTLSLSGGLSGASLSAASGPAGASNAVTLTVPVNNTTEVQTYTVSGTNGSHSSTVNVIQAAGIALLAPVSSEILMQEATAQLRVTTSFATTLKVFNDATDALVYSADLASTGSTASTETVTVGVNTGSAITYRAQLYNSNGDPVGSSVSFTQKPSIRITASSTSVAGNATDASVNVISDVDWELVSPDGATFGTYSGTPTTGGVAVPVSVTMPVNYTTSDKLYAIQAKGTGANSSLSASVIITRRKATLRTGQTVTFPCGSGRVYSSSVLTDTRNGITATFEGTLNSSSSTAHIRFGSGTGLHFTTDNTMVYEITAASFTFTGNNYRPTGGTASNGTMTWATTSTWAKSGNDPVTSLDLTFTRNNTTFRLSSFTITYTDYQWN